MGKTFEKQIKSIEDQEPKQVEALKTLKSDDKKKKKTIEDLIPKSVFSNDEIKN